jgi:RNA polymerase sigma-70 factor (sigma-E family)
VAVSRGEFETLYVSEFPNVFRTAYLMTGDRQEALDLAQETFVRAFERWRAVRGTQNPAAWLQRVVANLAISLHRRQRIRHLRGESRVEADLPAEIPDPNLMAALRALSPAQRVVIVLRYYADQSIEQVSETLGKRPGTITALTSQGLARLRAELKERINDEA